MCNFSVRKSVDYDQQMAELKTRCVELQQRLDERTDDNERLQTALGNAKQVSISLQINRSIDCVQTILDCKSTMSTMENQLTTQTTERNRLHIDLKTLRQRVDGVEGAKKELVTKQYDWKRENTELKRRIKTVNHQHSQLQ